ncbi:MAG: MFS transporter [Myxococcaceae bacterium]|nr:MFS transporter [Myxococcaceae bacterium]
MLPVTPAQGRQSLSPLRAFRHRDFLLLCLGAFVSNIGVWVGRVAVGVWVTETTGKASATGAVTALIFLPSILGPVGGAMSDRTSMRRWLVWVTIAQLLVGGTLATLATSGRLDVWLMSLLMVLTGCASVMQAAGFNRLIADLVPRADLTSAMFLNSGQWNLARVVGPLIAAPVIALGGTGPAFWLNAVLFVGVLGAVWAMKFPAHAKHEGGESLARSVAEGMKAARADPGIMSALAITALAGFFVAPFIGLIPVFALQVLKDGPAAASLLVAVQGAGAVVAALVSASLLDRVGAGQWLKVTCGALTALTMAFWLAPALPAALIVMFPLGGVYLSLVTGTARVCAGRAPVGALARVAGLYHVTLDATFALGLICTGAAADVIGLRQAGIMGCAVFAVILVSLQRSRRHVFAAMG